MNRLLGSFVLVASLLNCGLAQYTDYTFASGRGIGSTGSATVKPKPERIRLLMWVQAQGVDAKTAITALSEHKSRVKADLEKMKAESKSIEFSSVRLSAGTGDENQERQMAYMRRMMMQQNGDDVEMPEMPTIYTAICALKAEWPLPAGAGEAVALLPATLKQQIQKRDFAGEKNTPELDESAQERMEEMQAMMEDEYGGGFYGGSDEGDATVIYFVATISKEERQKALKKAFAEAKEDAEELAAAGGLKLSKLESVGVYANDDFDLTSYSRYGYQEQKTYPSSFLSPGKNSVFATTIDSLEKSYVVSMSHSLE